MDYKKKYLKYKNKYLELKNNSQIGGSNVFSIQLVKNALKNIEKDSYKIFQLNLTNSNKKLIKSIKINHSNNYNFFGNIDNLICIESDDLTNLIEFICLIGKNTKDLAKELVEIIKNILKTLSLGYEKKYCWLTIRSFIFTDFFQIPRFHCDGKYFKEYPEPQTKFVFVLKGSGTIFIKPNKQVKQIYNEYLTQSFNNIKPSLNSIEGRELLDKELKKINAKQLQINNKQGLIFLSGHQNCLIHSEPNITEPRLFLSIVFADEPNIDEWKNRKKLS